MSVSVSHLPNGIHVVTHAMPQVETVALGVWLRAGARDERTTEGGIAHLLEHMAFKGTTRRSAMDIAVEIEAVGGEINAATGMETTAYFCRVLKDDWRLALDILSDILIDPVFDSAELEREKDVILQEIAAAMDSPDDLVFQLVGKTAFPRHPLGRSILGEAQRVGKYDARSILRYRDLHYSAPRMVVSAAGRIDHSSLAASVEEKLSLFKSGIPADRSAPTFAGGFRAAEKPLDQIHLAVAFPAPSYRDDRIYALQVLSAIMGGGMSSRLFQEVREKRGLCYAVFSFPSSFQDIGLLNVYAATSPANAPELLKVMREVMLSLTGTVEESELQRAKAQLKAGLVISLERATSRADQIARQFLAFGRVPEISDIVEKIERLTVADIRTLADDVLHKSKPAISAVGALKALAPLEDIAARFA